tara:strand:+ start:566 stop:1114 length:549 start_codon:yes stop_codon:yes gene_type:complete
MKTTKLLLLISRKIDELSEKIGMVSKWSVILMLSIGFWNIIGRYVGSLLGQNISSNNLIESQWYLFDIIFLLGISWTHKRKGHVRVDVIQNRLQKFQKNKIEHIGTLFLLLPFAFTIMIISVKPALYSLSIYEVSPDPNGLPRYLIKMLIPLSFLFLGLQGISEAIKINHINTTSLKSTKID